MGLGAFIFMWGITAKCTKTIVLPRKLNSTTAHPKVLNYATCEHDKIYEVAMALLFGDKFDCTPENLANFLAWLWEKADNFTRMSTICKVKVADCPPVQYCNLIDDYGNLSLEQIRTHAATPYVNTENRK